MKDSLSSADPPQPLRFRFRLSADGRVQGGDGDALERLGVRLDAWIGRSFDRFIRGMSFSTVFRIASTGPLDLPIPFTIYPPPGSELIAGPAKMTEVSSQGMETLVTVELIQIRIQEWQFDVEGDPDIGRNRMRE